jgi:DnaJ family protein C protein 27
MRLRNVVSCILFLNYDRYVSTIGVDFGVRAVTMDDREIKVNFWDLCGDEEFLQTRIEFYNDTEGAIFVFDVCNRNSFTVLDNWLQEQLNNGNKPISTVVCANKIDLGPRQVTEEEGKRWAESKGFLYFETSAKSGHNVNAMFSTLFRTIVAAVAENESKFVSP